MGFARRVREVLLVTFLMASGLPGQESPAKRTADPRPDVPQLRLYDVRDLIYAFPDFQRKSGQAAMESPRQKYTGEDLANLIKFCVDRGKWEESDGKSIGFQNGLLSIRNSPGTLDSVDRFLGLLRDMTPVQHFFEIRILAVPASDPAGLLSCGVLAPKDAEALWREAERSRWVVGTVTAAAAEGQRVVSESGSLPLPRVEGSGVAIYSKAELYPVWAPERGTIVELQLEVLRSSSKDGGSSRVGEVRSTFALLAGGGCVLALGETDGTLYYALVRGRTVAPPGRGRMLDFMPNAAATEHLALIPIEDIVPALRDFVASPVDPGILEAAHAWEPTGPLLSIEQVVEFIKESTSKITEWGGNHTIEKTPSAQLLLQNTPESLAAVDKTLGNLWTLTMPPSLTVRLTAVEVDDAAFGRFREVAGVAAFPAPFGRDDRGRILQSLSSGTSIEDVSVTCYPAQRAFVRAYPPSPSGSGPAASKARMPVLRTSLDVRGLPSPGRKECLLDLRVDLGKPGATTAGNPGEEEGGESWRLTSTVPLGGGLILGAYPSPGAARRWHV
ncbi:MAG TPA: hypothetical protein VMU54_26570, partial [Planctomycetota bacterium]|nr:hypothetical protein [Planctomycetota bacterium]